VNGKMTTRLERDDKMDSSSGIRFVQPGLHSTAAPALILCGHCF
jgi:hypothetical protein